MRIFVNNIMYDSDDAPIVVVRESKLHGIEYVGHFPEDAYDKEMDDTIDLAKDTDKIWLKRKEHAEKARAEVEKQMRAKLAKERVEAFKHKANLYIGRRV